jgi:YjbE family integral membrane protein
VLHGRNLRPRARVTLRRRQHHHHRPGPVGRQCRRYRHGRPQPFAGKPAQSHHLRRRRPIGLRILFTALATLLLGVPGLQAVGGILLFYIAYKLIRPHNDAHGAIKEADSLGEAIRTIVLADVVMSLDNILAVGGAAKGHLGLLMFGLLLSIPIILFGSELVARLLGRFPAFLYVGVYVLVHAAVAMLLHDPWIASRVPPTTLAQELAISLAVTAVIIGIERLMQRTRTQRAAVAPVAAER